MDGARDEKRASLIDTAFAVLKRQGFRKTTLDDIASAAGMATTSMYYYFPNKHELLRSVMDTLVSRALKEMETAIAAARTPEDKLVVTLKVLFSAVRDSGFLLNRQNEPKPAVLAVIDDQIKEFERKYRATIRKIILDGVHSGVFEVDDVDLAVTVLSSGAIGLITHVVGEDEYSMIESKIEKIGATLMNGLRRR
jgi:AcrR family transcriptional regulator